ncbi:CBS domain-containing protein [Aequorivita sp. H23M31]|uniref:CBS domain-containing protein n=1 Tax=Aequorivita ciconiae TaxID=2494375 RepID=A0A410G3A9_9FLAO|nr:chloride channel protein [Aequorivita sp. H23M31]QAA81778.1 CBS domain-containing protein [Aequorivita sp. H23M31]
MKNNNIFRRKGIPVSVSLSNTVDQESSYSENQVNKRRIFTIALLAFVVALCISFLAKFLVHLISLITNISFYGNVSVQNVSPAGNHLGLLVIIIPAIGGLVVGLMALYGSKQIRGHGIPEAMEQILTNKSKIKPAITYLKPVSSAISIGTGGPFGAEGPIIATGGALGSTLGQMLRITDNERKILLAAGATAGMAAIFGSPVAAIFLAIELLLFEFSPRSFIPVAVACITGAAGHHFLFGSEVVFPIETTIEFPSNMALFIYSLMGIVIGIFSVLATKIVYLIEDGFEKLPIHWAWWPAIGGLGVGVVGYFAPSTLGVGYDNIIAVLSGNLTLKVLLSLCVLKFISWAIALGSGTSGGTLAPLMTIGGALGALIGIGVIEWFPNGGIVLPLAALVGMSAMFAGASRAFLTSIVFALETTGQSNALLPLLAACTTAYFVSYFIMENTIMTEKMARRGVAAPLSYVPDILEKLRVGEVLDDNGIVIGEENTVQEVRDWLGEEEDYQSDYFIVSNDKGEYKGILSSLKLLKKNLNPENKIGTLSAGSSVHVKNTDTLRRAVELMAKESIDVIPVISNKSREIIGVLSYRDIMGTYKYSLDEHLRRRPNVSLKRRGLKIVVRGKKLSAYLRSNRK